MPKIATQSNYILSSGLPIILTTGSCTMWCWPVLVTILIGALISPPQSAVNNARLADGAFGSFFPCFIIIIAIQQKPTATAHRCVIGRSSQAIWLTMDRQWRAPDAMQSSLGFRQFGDFSCTELAKCYPTRDSITVGFFSHGQPIDSNYCPLYYCCVYLVVKVQNDIGHSILDSWFVSSSQ